MSSRLFGVPALPVALIFIAALGAFLVRPDSIAVRGAACAFSAAAFVWAVRAHLELSALRKQVRAMEALGRQAIDAQNLDNLLAHLLTAARDLIRFDRAFIWIADTGGERLRLRAARPANAAPKVPAEILSGEGLVGRVAERCRGLVIMGGDDAPQSDPAGGEGMASLLVVPLATGERTVGVALFARRQKRQFAPRDLDVMQGVAGGVASAIENTRLHQSIRTLAVTDGLTGLTNHRRLQEILSEEVWRSRRYGRPFSVILCDVDSFKEFNDTYGHPQGDDLLRRMAGVLRASVRVVDTVARYGGEEFCILLPETGRLQAQKMAERLRRAVAEIPLPGKDGGQAVHKTMSFGVASFPQDTPDGDRLITLADEALYHAKRAGKNQVQLAGGAPTVPTAADAS